METSSQTVRRLSMPIPPELAGWRVGKVLRVSLKLSGTLLRRIKCLEDGILLEGQRVSVRTIVETGQTLSVRIGDCRLQDTIVPAPGPLNIIHEDGDLLILNKQAGVLSHPGHGHFDDTLGNFVVYYYQSRGIFANYHPVHRLDKGTTGLFVIAKHVYAQELLKSALHNSDFRRIYLAICDGVPKASSGVVDAPIQLRSDSLVQREISPGGLPARTWYKVLSVFEGRSLVRLELETGRTHQIRVHMAHLGCPLTGDYLYGDLEQQNSAIQRPALHSYQLWLRQPVTGELLQLTAPLPADMKLLLPPALRSQFDFEH